MFATRHLLFAVLCGAVLAYPVQAAESLKVYRSAHCGCCGDWVEYLRAEGVSVDVVISEQLPALKRMLGVPAELVSCHTGVVAGRFVEGHVPVAEVRALMAADASVRGVAVPGMPLGSPGMEVEGRTAQSYSIIAVAADGRQTVIADY